MSILVASRLLRPRAHTACVFADQVGKNLGEPAEQVLSFISPHTLPHSLPMPKPVIIQSPLDHMTLGLGLG